jgi:hypothetical protein
MCHSDRVVRRLLVLLLAAALLASGCGGDDRAAVEQEDWIVELEIPLTPELDEPEVYGQVGMSPNGRNGTRIVLRLDEPFSSPMQAFIRRGGCGSFRGLIQQPDFPLPDVKDGKLEAEVDAPTRELREGYVLIVREPISEEELDQARDRSRTDPVYEKGACGDLSSADRVEEF